MSFNDLSLQKPELIFGQAALARASHRQRIFDKLYR